ncbi:zinc-binding dehydrogenase [Acidimangrovimonas sediminis]|uniref:zinc-binding dehydrogenase n=1 Tax=Acidimangrovimonas sediminis TaxID=2056283 RepID=UPI0022B87F32|nr:zinc-binding dehydrogenase [Acidimangrovimonas sediminis]
MSGGVGSAVAQLTRRRGAEVIGITSSAKADMVRAFGVDHVLTREDDPIAVVGQESVDVVVDNVADAGFGTMLRLLRRGAQSLPPGSGSAARSRCPEIAPDPRSPLT